MGLIEGTKVRKINQALDGSVIFMVRGTRLAVGKELMSLLLFMRITQSIQITVRREGKKMASNNKNNAIHSVMYNKKYEAEELNIGFVGNPNSGKTTFLMLTPVPG